MSTPDESRDPADMNVECRSCPERAPAPVSIRDGAAWMEQHGREAHGDPYLGARWTRAPREGRRSR